jgi:hypothetical protein
MPGVRAAHIQTLRLLPERLRAAVSGLSDAQLDTPYREGGWTVRQVVHHVARQPRQLLRPLQAGAHRRLADHQAYDEAAWANLADSRWPGGGSLAMIEALHGRWVALLESLSDEDFQKGI